jgi:hypothetical protein
LLDCAPRRLGNRIPEKKIARLFDELHEPSGKSSGVDGPERDRLGNNG